MKSFYAFLLLLLAFANPSKAQLAGYYTINNTLPTAASNFSTFSDLATVLNSAGVAGYVTVDVQGSNTYTEQLSFSAIPGTSSQNRIVLFGNGRTLTYSGTPAQPWTLLLNGADYMSIYNLNIEGTGSSAQPCHLTNSADNNQFLACSFSVTNSNNNPSSSPFSISGHTINLSTNGPGAEHTSVRHCTLSGGYYGCRIAGNTAAPFSNFNEMVNCSIVNFYVYGSYVNNSPQTRIEKCAFLRPTINPVGAFYGIYLGSDCEGSSLEANSFEQPYGAVPGSTLSGYGIYNSSNGTSLLPVKILNNLIFNFASSGSIYGIYNSTANQVQIDHNTLCFSDSTGTGNANVYAIYSALNGNRVKNNLIYLARGSSGIKYGLYYPSPSSSGTLVSNGNWVYIAPNFTNNAHYGYNNGNYTTHSQWNSNTNMDLTGGQTNPLFAGGSSPGSYLPSSSILNNGGEAIGVLKDFYQGTLRYSLFPDPGAFEFLSPNCSAGFNALVGLNGQVNFTGGSTPFNAFTSQYHWNFGNNVTYSNTGLSGSSTIHTYTASGNYAVQLTVTNPSIGCTASAFAYVNVNTCNLYASFTHSNNANGLVTLSSSSSGTNANTSYTWNLGNGFTSNASQLTHSYSSSGYYLVNFTVSNGPGCFSTYQDTVIITNQACLPNANFNMVPTSIQQYWNAVPVSPWNIISASWNWGDGSPTTNSLYTSHQYASAGMYSICLTVTASCAGTASACSSYSIFKTTQSANMVYVNVQAPALQTIPTNTVGMAEQSLPGLDFFISPNPGNGAFTVNGLEKTNGKLKVYSADGRLVLEKLLNAFTTSDAKQLDLSYEPPGLYVLVFETDDTLYTKKFIIGH